MQRTLFVVLILVFAAVGFYAYQQNQLPELTELVTDTNTQKKSDSDAQRHIQSITPSADQPIDIQSADHFVTAEQLIALPDTSVSTQANIEEIAEPAQTLESAQKKETAPTTDEIATPQENSNSQTPNHNLSSSDEASQTELTTTQIDDNTYAVSSHLSVISKPLPSPSSSEEQKPSTTLEFAGNQIKLQELLNDPNDAKEKLFFIHAVNAQDNKGLWGIIQNGLTDTFIKGLNLPGLDKTAFVEIPQEADEKLADMRSSFLGRILKSKVDQTYIYNYDKGILGDNPNLIKPGQQLVIVTFTEQELIDIYQHFVNL